MDEMEWYCGVCACEVDGSVLCCVCGNTICDEHTLPHPGKPENEPDVICTDCFDDLYAE